MTQLLMTLRHYATTSFFQVAADFAGVSKSTAHYTIHKVTRALCLLARDEINFPSGGEELFNLQKVNYGIAGFPKVLAFIDGTHIKMYSPGMSQISHK